MRFLHTADTHLGFTAYNRLDDNGINQREADVYRIFESIIDMALHERVDAVVHSGDLFDSVRPSNRAITHALEQLRRLQDADIPFVGVSGNHSTPRLRETGSVFSILSVLSNVVGIYKGRYEAVEVGDMLVHAVPHCSTNEVFGEELLKLVPSSNKRGYQVAMLHAGVVGVDVFRMGDVNENTCPMGPLLQGGFDYVALGHYHRHTEVARNVVYAGSPERLSFAEALDKKGCVLVDLNKSSWRLVELPARPMHDLCINWKGESAAEVMESSSAILEGLELKDSLVRLTIRDIPNSVQRGVDMRGLRSLGSQAMVFQSRFILAEEEDSGGGLSMRPLGSEFEEFMSRYRVEHLDRERLSSLGRDYLEKAGGGG